MSANLEYLGDEYLVPTISQWPLPQDDRDTWSSQSAQSLDGDNEHGSLTSSGIHSPLAQWNSPPIRLQSPPVGFEEKQFEPRFSVMFGIHMADMFQNPEEDYSSEYHIPSSLSLEASPVQPILGSASCYLSPSSALATAGAAPLPTPYFDSPPVTATTAGVEVAMPRPSKHYQFRLAERYAAGTPEACAASPATDTPGEMVGNVPGYGSESPVAENNAPESMICIPDASISPIISHKPSPELTVNTSIINRKRRASSTGTMGTPLSPASRKRSRKAYNDALIAASTGPPGTKLYPKRLATPYQAFLDQLVLPVLKRISEPTKWLVVGGQRSPAFGKLLWERVDEEVKKAWFDRMNTMREEWNATAPENAQCPVQPKPKPETMPKIGKAYREVLGHIEPLVVAFFAGVERMGDMMPGGEPFIDQKAMELAAQGKADVLGFGDDAKGGPLKCGVKPPGTILVGPSAASSPKLANKGVNSRVVRPLPRARSATLTSRQALTEQLVVTEAPIRRSFRCGFMAIGDSDKNVMMSS